MLLSTNAAIHVLQIVNSISEFSGGRDETVVLSGHSFLSSLAASYTQPVNQIWRNLNNNQRYVEIKTPTRTSNTDPPVIECADASAVRFVLAVWFITSWLLTLCVEVYVQMCTGYCPQLPLYKNVFKGLRFACMLHVVLVKCWSPWGTFLLPIGKPSLRRWCGAQPSCAWTYRFAVVNASRQTGWETSTYVCELQHISSGYVISQIGNSIPVQ